MAMFKPSILTLALTAAGLSSFATTAAQEETIKNDDVEIIEVREATEEELAHGHVHSEEGCGHEH